MARVHRPLRLPSAPASGPLRRLVDRRGLRTIAIAAVAGIMLLPGVLFGSIASASTPTTLGYRDFGYGGALATRPTSDPEQSKLWYNDGAWWAGLFVSSGSGSGGSHFDIFRLNPATHSWVDTTRQIDIRDLSHGDYLWDAAHNKLYVASSKSICQVAPAPPAQPCNDSVRVYRYSYNGAATTLATKYTLDTGFPKVLIGGQYSSGANFTGGGSNAVTIAIDSTGHLWLAYTRDDPTTLKPPIVDFHSTVYLADSTDGVTWSTPAHFSGAAVGQSGQDNTASVVAFGGNKVGLYWTDKHATGASFAYFAVHNDGDPVGTWTPDAAPVTSGVNAIEDQVNLKSDTTGKVYAIAKTGVADQIRLFDRSTSGTWTSHNVWTAGNGNIRAQVVLDEQLGLAFAFSSSGGTTAGTIYVKTAPLATLDFPTGKGAAFIASASDHAIDDVTLAKQEVDSTTGIVAEASDRLSFQFLHGEMALAASDATPPSGSVSINGGAAFTGSPNVTLAVPASDAGSGVALVRVANTSNSTDGSGALDGGGATSFGWAPTVPWTLVPGDGAKVVWVQFQDGAGNWSTPTGAGISLDQTGPTGTIAINGGAAQTNSTAVSLAVPATDEGVGAVSNVRIANVGTTSAGVLTDPSAVTSAYAPAKSWTLAGGADGPRSVYVQWQDSLGNWSGVSNDTITLDTTPPAAGTVSIDGGATSTSASDRQVTLTLSDPDGVDRIRIAESLAGLASATPQAYATSAPFTLSPGLDGTRTIYVQWLDDAGNASTPASDSIILDLRHPVGTVAINGGATGIRSLSVTLTFPNSDTDIDTIRISNSSTMAGAVTVGTPGVVFSGGRAWTLAGPLTNGAYKSVYVTFHDLAGNTSDIVAGAYSATDSARVDLTRPVLRGVVATSWVRGSTFSGNSVALRASWPAATDTVTGVAGYRVWLSKDGRAYTLIGAPVGRSITISAASGHSYRFRVYAIDHAGNTSLSIYSPIVRAAAYQDTSTAIRYSSGWRLARSLAYYGGTSHTTIVRGASATLRFTGRSVAWTTVVASNRGSARVYIDGRLFTTVSLYSPTATFRKVVFARTWSASGIHTIRIVGLATAGRPRIDLDAFLVLR